jgi:hypothetical protein
MFYDLKSGVEKKSDKDTDKIGRGFEDKQDEFFHLVK